MAVRIRLLRMGKIRNPQYRIVVADARTKRDGRAIEEIGLYHPKEDPSRIEVNSERAQYWLSVGAQPSEPVRAILSKTGDWQKFKGLPPPAEPLKVAAARADRTAIYEAEAKAAAGLTDPADAKTKKSEPARKAAKTAVAKGEAPAAPAAKAEEAKAEPVKAEEAKAEPVKADAVKADAVKAEPKAEPVQAESAEAPGAGTDAAG